MNVNSSNPPLKSHVLLTGMMVNFLVVALTITLAYGLFVTSNRDGLRDTAWLIILGVALATYIGFLYLRYVYPTFPPVLHPPVQTGLWLIITFFLPGIAGLYDPKIGGRWATTDETVLGWLIVLQGMFSLWVGYIISSRLFKRSNTTETTLSVSPVSKDVCILLYAIFTSLVFLRIAVIGIAFGADKTAWGAFSIFDNTIRYFDNARYLLIIIAVLGAAKFKWSKQIALSFLVVEVFFAMISGFMKPMLWLSLICLLTLYSVNVVISWRLVRTFLFILPIMIILGVGIVPIAEGIRANQAAYGTTSVESAVDAVVDAYDTSWGQGFDVGWEIFVDKMLSRQVGVSEFPGLTIQKTPSVIPFEGFSRFFEIPLYTIPRFILPGKPILSRGIWFSVEYLGYASDTTTSNAPTIFGEAYMYAGTVGVIFGSSMLGMLLGFIAHKFTRYSAGIILIALFPTYIDVEGMYSTMVVGLLQSALVFTLVYWFAVKLSSSKRR